MFSEVNPPAPAPYVLKRGVEATRKHVQDLYTQYKLIQYRQRDLWHLCPDQTLHTDLPVFDRIPARGEE